ncbi:MAG: 4'-phosphopantetheinyl transferase superfamily protein [Chitinophagaceae bacterium]|nr:4'-phosphopantetheinyl transferase superfamily protein [Chitinophagaceae bacterium]
MPLFYTQNINETTRLAIWHITETEDFFRKIYIPITEISHPHKRLQHLAGRFLLQLLDSKFPVNKIHLDGRRPFLPDNSRYFSISHCGDYAAAILSKDTPVGIDVELVTPKLQLLEKKFLTEQEQKLIKGNDSSTSLKRLTSCWSAKESMFKWYILGNVDFRKDMIITSYTENGDKAGKITAIFGKELNTNCDIEYRFFDDLCLAWLCREKPYH